MKPYHTSLVIWQLTLFSSTVLVFDFALANEISAKDFVSVVDRKVMIEELSATAREAQFCVST